MLRTRALLTLMVVLGALGLSAPALASPPIAQIIGGSAAAAGAAPYAVEIQATSGPSTYFCTGSLIAPQFVLTAGHCTFDDTGTPIPVAGYRIRIGVSDWTTNPTVRTVTAVSLHPAFNPNTLQGDVAVLKLDQVAQAGTSVIPLATSADAALYAAGQPATAMGWGITANGAASIPNVLQTGTVAVQANATCNSSGAGLSFRPSYDMCTAAPSFVPAACHGDSGGPLVATTATGPVQIGVVSYGTSGTCALGPDFFTRASSIQAWAASVAAGAPITTPFVPPYAAPAATLALSADGVVATFSDAPDPATLLTGFIASLTNAAGVVVASQPLSPSATTASFPAVQPGSYTVGVVADYTEGTSAAGTSAAVVLAPPANTVRPSIKGTGRVGSTLSCQPGTWVWPGAATLTALWLRNGASTGVVTQGYRVREADAGAKLACQVLLRASTGPTATATSAALQATEKLAVRTRPRLTGSHAVGARLVCSAGAWKHTGSLRLSYAWLRDGKAITGAAARKARRTIAAGDAGHRLTCRVKAKTAGQSASATSSAVKATA
ncbi:MAG TPA: serine protease [Gaiellales bacterium]|jgi:hypothetical protein